MSVWSLCRVAEFGKGDKKQESIHRHKEMLFSAYTRVFSELVFCFLFRHWFRCVCAVMSPNKLQIQPNQTSFTVSAKQIIQLYTLTDDQWVNLDKHITSENCL